MFRRASARFIALIAVAVAGVVAPPWAAPASAVQGQLLMIDHSRKCLEVELARDADKAPLIQNQCRFTAPYAHQIWGFFPVGTSGYAQIKAYHSGKCIDIWDGSTDDTADAIQYRCDSDKTHQQFKKVPNQQGNGFLLKARHSGKCLELKQASDEIGIEVHQMPCDINKGTQRFIAF
jgi:hypothetical protein